MDRLASARPWHLWVVGVLAAVWNAVGVYDYVLTETRNLSYLAQFTAEQLAYFQSFPAWAVAGWALGVWGGVAGAILLLAQNRLAVIAFALSLAGAITTTVFQMTATPPASLKPTSVPLFAIAIDVAAALLLWYATRMRARGMLR